MDTTATRSNKRKRSDINSEKEENELETRFIKTIRSASATSNDSSMASNEQHQPVINHEILCPAASRYLNFDKRRKLFLHQKGITDIDAPPFRSNTYDTMYAWSIWTNQRRVEEYQDVEPTQKTKELNAVHNGVAIPQQTQQSTSRSMMTAPSTVTNYHTVSSSSSSSSSSLSVADHVTQPMFSEVQRDLTDTMRNVLLEWLSDVSAEYRMQSSTYFLSIRLLDRVLKLLPIRRTKFQLLGCACLMIAAKLEEMEGPTAENWVFLSDNSFTSIALIGMEDLVLQALDFRIFVHSSYYFMNRLAMAAGMSDKEKSYATMLLEIALHDFSISAYERMSKTAAAACHLTLQTLRPSHVPLWTKSMEFFSGGYRDSDPSFRSLIQRLRALHWNIDAAPYRNIVRKYEKLSRWHRVGLIGALREKDMRYTEQEILVSSSGSSLVSPPPSLLPPQFGSDYDDGMDSNLGGQGLLSFAYEPHHMVPISTQSQSQSQRFSGGGVLSERVRRDVLAVTIDNVPLPNNTTEDKNEDDDDGDGDGDDGDGDDNDDDDPYRKVSTTENTVTGDKYPWKISLEHPYYEPLDINPIHHDDNTVFCDQHKPSFITTETEACIHYTYNPTDRCENVSVQESEVAGGIGRKTTRVRASVKSKPRQRNQQQKQQKQQQQQQQQK